MMKSHTTSLRVWVSPVFIGVTSIVGLLAALLADGSGDILSWFTLSIPVVAIIWSLNRKA